MVGELRNHGERVELELRSRKIGKALNWANNIGAAYAMVIGPRDVEQGKASIKRLSDGEQVETQLNSSSVLEALQQLRSS